MLDSATTATPETKSHEVLDTQASEQANTLPPLLVRQLIECRRSKAKWKRNAVHRVWIQRDHAYAIAAAGDVPVLSDEHERMQRRRVVPLDPRGSLAELVGILFDRVAASGALPVLVVDVRGSFVVFLPAVPT